MKKVDQFLISIETLRGSVNLEVVPYSDNDELFECENIVSNQSLEAKYQLKEGSRYHYYFGDNDSQFAQDNSSGIIIASKSKNHLNEGIINTGTYVGSLTLDIVSKQAPGEKIGEITFEVQSVKIDYLSDYQIMLEDITNYYVELIMAQSSPITQNFEVDLENLETHTLYQRFTFIKSIIGSEAFVSAINKICHNPIKRWTGTIIEKKITAIGKIGRKDVRQIINRQNRNYIRPEEFGFPHELTSLPNSIETTYKKETTNVMENQFVKFVLLNFQQFCSRLIQLKNSSSRLKAEAKQTEIILDQCLSSMFFKDIDNPVMLNFNSPALQRKEGYREIMQAWLFFDLSAKLAWKGGDNVYKAGKRNVAALYEYWIFFLLKKVISDFFKIESQSLSSLVKTDEDGIVLDICQGKTKVIKGIYQNPFRNLRVEFYYNKIFNPSTDPNLQGSWTIPMRPDYTLAIWPEDLLLEEAEKENLIVYIHFDAKYRLREILFRSMSDEDINIEKEEEAQMIYKQGDILKMHAYKDAIRRTAGVYILYPGNRSQEFRGYHEVIPGLGAFDIRPGDNNCVDRIREFLGKVVENLLNRSSMRERMATHEYIVAQEKFNDTRILKKNLPESMRENRNFIPDETTVLLAYCKNEIHYKWILDKQIYNFRIGRRKGSISITGKLASARYILLHDGKNSLGFFKLKKSGPKIFSKKDLIEMAYPIDPEKEDEKDYMYLVYHLLKAEKNYSQFKWNMEDFKEIKGKNTSRIHFMNLTDLMLKSRIDYKN